MGGIKIKMKGLDKLIDEKPEKNVSPIEVRFIIITHIKLI